MIEVYRGTTPTIVFNIPIDTQSITELNIAVAQFGKVIIQKGIDEVSLSSGKVEMTLTEEETLSLKSRDRAPLEIQMRIGVGDLRFASQIFTVAVKRILNEGKLDEL